ncbi:hypothetical protein [Bythopirellula polymerisocia]|uniref:Uncharacterized protein n=1 Tax=Bythopirellula polymerisocia TaxID=2528003 RepID=A0A5C6D1Q2_9BACT|nr:hypothetical protein [Bythopirellula polymerisocia]TWU29764.1 hypothetical protein Pla144_05430 [Bythopirellula polymerisocia]
MMNESDATREWRQLFEGQSITTQLLVKAESLVGQLPSESPLRLRFATEIDELRHLNQPAISKKKR